MKKKHLFLFFLQIIFCNFLFAQTWNGNTDTDWNTSSNWTPANVPSPTGYVTIPDGLISYPVLASNVSIRGITMETGSRLDFNGHSMDMNSTTNYNFFSGTLNNSNGSSDIVINVSTGTGGFGVYLRGNTVNDNITFNLTGSNSFVDADGATDANTYNGDLTINVNSNLILILSNGARSQYNGNLTISRTVTGGTTTLFNSGADISGNFKFVNNLDGKFEMGNTAKQTNISGKVDITLMNDNQDYFRLYNIKNLTSGGMVNVQKTLGFDVQKDTLMVNSFSITGYRGNNYGEFYNNDITGDLNLASDVLHSGGYGTYLRSNIIKGNADITVRGANTFYEADNGGGGNKFTGNVKYTIEGTSSLIISNGDASEYQGNLTIFRTGAGNTVAFNEGASIAGDFSFTNNTAGNSTFGNISKTTNVGGKVDVSIDYTTPGNFQLYRIINSTTGGVINVQNSYGFDVQKDTLLLNAFNITGYTGSSYGLLYNNDITGDLTLASAVGHINGYNSYLRSNIFRGDADITVRGANTFYEADNGGSANRFTGNVNYTIEGISSLILSNGDKSEYQGNLTILRKGAGITTAFNAGAIIGKDFSFTNNTAGNTRFGDYYSRTTIGGKVDININDTTPGNFKLYRMINQTAGGVINVQNTYGFEVQNDTLLLSDLSITGYTGNSYGTLYNNDITGNITLTSGVGHTGGYHTYLRSNIITGNASFSNNGNNIFYDADNGNSGNRYTANVTYNKNSNAAFSVGAGDTTSIGGSLSLNSDEISLGKIQFTGNTNGIVQQTGNTPINIATLVMNKGGLSNITLMDKLNVSTSLNLNSGIIVSGVNSNLVLADNKTYLGGSDSSYVDGPMLKIGNDAFIFPVGNKNKFAPISMTAPALATDQFRAQYIKKMPQKAGYDTLSKDASLNNISRVEYWLLDRVAGSSDVKVTLSFNFPRSGVITFLPDLRVTRWDGSMWKDLGNGSTTGDETGGTIQTSLAVNSFSPFTLASITRSNPLPISITRFEATKKTQSVSLNWTTENTINFSNFEIERADGNNQFVSIGKVTANNNSSLQSYNFEDNQPLKGVNLYRLKLAGSDGKVVYSNVRSILFNANGTITIYPNPASDYITIDGISEGTALEIHDASGKVVKRMLSNASNRYSVSELRKGMYFIKIMDKENTSVSKLVIR